MPVPRFATPIFAFVEPMIRTADAIDLDGRARRGFQTAYIVSLPPVEINF
jgi:hypothetical protein